MKAKSENGPIFLAEDLVTLEPYKVNSSYVIDLPQQSEVLTSRNISASELVRGLNATLVLLNDTWPLWRVCIYCEVQSRSDKGARFFVTMAFLKLFP